MFHSMKKLRSIVFHSMPVLTAHGNQPLAIEGSPMVTGKVLLAYVEAFPPVAHKDGP